MAAPALDWDHDRLIELAKDCTSLAALARRYGVKPNTLLKHLEGHREVRAQINAALRNPDEPPDASQHVETDSPEWGDARRLIKSRDMNPDDWLIVRARVNEWGAGTCTNCEAEVKPLTQLRVDLEPAERVVLPARVDGWTPPKAGKPPARDERLVVFLSDQHAPHHDEELHAAAVAFLHDQQPDVGIINGDLMDMDGGVSRHRHDPVWHTTLQAGVDTAGRLVRDYVAASPGTEWSMLAGNHEDRLRNAVLDQLRGVTGLTRFDDDAPVLSVPHLLRLDEIGVEYAGSGQEYAQHSVRVADNLTARHGWISAKGAGASALKTLDAVRHHVAVGHTHRQGIVAHTHWTIDGEAVTLLGCEVGTMARTKGGLGYIAGGVPDWQQGFATASLWPDGTVSFDLARWDGRSLVWRGQRWA